MPLASETESNTDLLEPPTLTRRLSMEALIEHLQSPRYRKETSRVWRGKPSDWGS